MKTVLAALVSLCLFAAPCLAAPAVPGAGSTVAPASTQQGPIPPADVGPAPPGSPSMDIGVSQIAIGAMVIGGAIVIGLATEGGLSAAIATAAAVMLIYAVMP